MPDRRAYAVKLCLKSPFLFQGLTNARLGIDSAYLRDEKDMPLIPDTQIRGVLRHACTTLAKATDGAVINHQEIDALFGQSSDAGDPEAGTDMPLRACAIFSDLTASIPPQNGHTTRIEIDDEKGRVKDGALQVIELAYPFGQKVVFEGSLIVRHKPGLDADRVEKALNKALALIPCIGSLKSVGFGEVIAEENALEKQPRNTFSLKPTMTDRPFGSDRKLCEMTLDRPLLVNASRIAENVFQSDSIIPGAAIKGALAQRLAFAGMNTDDGGPLATALAALRLSHAFPVAVTSKGIQPLDHALPASLQVVKSADGALRFHDAITLPKGEACLIGGQLPDFAASAKDRVQAQVRDLLGMGVLETPSLNRTHVMIGPDTWSAVDGKLYVTRRRSHRSANGSDQIWTFTADFGAVEDEGAKALLCAALTGPLDGLGRSASTATIHQSDLTEDLPTAEALLKQDHLDIRLLSPAILTDPQMEHADNIWHAHARYFEDNLDGTELFNQFASRELVGGYVAVRHRPYGRGTYYPYVVTRPGSVFRLRLPSEAAARAMAHALRYGLPVPPLNGHKTTWKTCGYQPENGYGAIALHQQLWTAHQSAHDVEPVRAA
ncbi:MAG: RAMP superfamily CRISPR-associated protein [Pseudomonadota bacterium]